MELKLLLWLTFLVYNVSGDTFTHRQKSHNARALTTSKLKKVAKLSDFTVFRDQLLKPFLRERVSGSEGNKQVQDHIKNTLDGFGWHIEEDDFDDDTPYGKKHFSNIIATVNPLAPRRLTLACHFDSKYFEKFTFIGATDSAVPCAMLLDLAHTLDYALSKQQNSEVTLQLIFFDGEEAFKQWTNTDSIYGARHLAERWETEMHKVDRDAEVPKLKTMDMMILLDLLGTKEANLRNWFEPTNKWFQRMQKIEKKLANAGLLHVEEKSKNFFNPNTNRYFLSNVERWRGGIEDDHIPFHRRGVPIMHLISYPFPDVWHTEADNDKAIDYDTVDDLNKIIRTFVAEYLHLAT